MIKIGLYPGCSLKGGSREYKESVEAVAKSLGIELTQIPDWNCCGATAAHNLNHVLSLSLPARILALAEEAGMEEILVPCAACYSRLKVTEYELNNDAKLKAEVIELVGKQYSGKVQIINIIEFLEKYVINNLKDKIVKPFNYKSACYYGCLLVRPHEILKFDRVEDPLTMDQLIKEIGGEPIEWAFKTECCGAGLSVSRTDIVAKLSGKIIEDAIYRQAEVLIVACPMCHSNLDMRRPEINKFLKKSINTPVLYITQAIGLALGIDPKDLGIHRHLVKVNLPEKVREVPLEKTEKVTTEE